ncbi:MAG: hypothetical protein HY259_11850 [Chloroflexi bacterium]|nr:hypothetical protein [Chloroflexota bacterium]
MNSTIITDAPAFVKGPIHPGSTFFGYSADSSGRSNRHTARCLVTAWLAPDWIGGWPWLRLVGAKPRVDITTLQDRRLTRCFAPTHTISRFRRFCVIPGCP